MKLISTRGAGPVDLRTAVLSGLAPDGGLYLPERIERLPEPILGGLRGRTLPELGTRLASHLLGGELEDDIVRELVTGALDFPVPLVPVADGAYVLELFHGPTASFKDVGARFLAGLVALFGARAEREVVVLVATSGDTGSAVAHAFHRQAGVRTVVLFPEGKVSPIQRRQLTELGGNVRPVAVAGTFDDCQRLVKRGLADPELRREALVTSANSISIGRLLPQSFYYFHAWSQLGGESGPLFSVPSGNLGNLTGGILASRMGLPVAGFLAATNANDTLERFLASGRLEPRPAVPTLSSAMDVAEPSNLERLLHLYGRDPTAMAREIRASSHSDGDTLDAIRRVHDEHGYLMDPHTAVGWLALEAAPRRDPRTPAVVLSTASPAKFPETVERATGVEPDWRTLLREGASGEGAPRPRVVEIEPDYEALRPVLGD